MGFIRRRPLVGVVILLLAALAIPFVAGREPAVPQPVAFNHLKHTQELQLACDFCHQYVNTGAHAGLPNAETCTVCHQVPQGTSDRLPSHVFYTHRRHVGIGELECVNCHGAIAETERPPARALVRIDMDLCINCHLEHEQTVDCNACHR